VLISLTVKPGSRKGPMLETLDDGTMLAHVRAKPIDGEANEALIELVAKHFSVSKSRVSLVSGQKSRHKRLQIDL
jgi:uncharacterized protein